MAVLIERFGGTRHERCQPDSPGCIAASALKSPNLLEQSGLTRADRALVQCIYVIEDPNEHLHPFIFGAAQLLDLEAQVGLLSVVGAFEKLAESFRFRGHSRHESFGTSRRFLRLL